MVRENAYELMMRVGEVGQEAGVRGCGEGEKDEYAAAAAKSESDSYLCRRRVLLVIIKLRNDVAILTNLVTKQDGGTSV